MWKINEKGKKCGQNECGRREGAEMTVKIERVAKKWEVCGWMKSSDRRGKINVESNRMGKINFKSKKKGGQIECEIRKGGQN